MSDQDLLAYVQATAALLELPLDGPRAERVAQHLQRTAAMARLLDAAPLAAHAEIAEIFCPAPFPQELP